jgi:chromosomal replication initiator protein
MTMVRDIQEAVCLFFGIPQGELVGPSRAMVYCLPRMVAMYLTREFTPDSYPQIGRDYHRHHATVISDVRKAERLIRTDWRVRAAVEELFQRLGHSKRWEELQGYFRRAA